MIDKKLIAAAFAVIMCAAPALAQKNTPCLPAYIPDWAVEAVYGTAMKSGVPKQAMKSVGFRKFAGGGDYLGEMTSEGADRWAPERMPLRIFISPNQSARLFASAMEEWCSASGGKLCWTAVSDPGSADVTVDWQQNAPAGIVESGETRNRMGVSANGQRVIIHSSITLITMNGSMPYSDQEMHKICLHEIGHALGLKHSSTSGDIMFWQSNPAQLSALGPRDANTISRLYSVAE